MSKIFKIYHTSNLIDVLILIIRLFGTEQSNANQLNAIKITLNASAFDAEFDISNTIMRNFISKNQTIKFKLQKYINNYFCIYYEKHIQNRNF